MLACLTTSDHAVEVTAHGAVTWNATVAVAPGARLRFLRSTVVPSLEMLAEPVEGTGAVCPGGMTNPLGAVRSAEPSD